MAAYWEIAAYSAYDMVSKYKYLIVNLVFSHLVFFFFLFFFFFFFFFFFSFFFSFFFFGGGGISF